MANKYSTKVTHLNTGYNSGRMFEVYIDGVKQQGVFSADECGEKLACLLHIMGGVKISFKEVTPKRK
jgi:hypothetical protein